MTLSTLHNIPVLFFKNIQLQKRLGFYLLFSFLFLTSQGQTLLDSSYGNNGKLVIQTGYENSPWDYYSEFNSVCATRDGGILRFTSENFYMEQEDVLWKFTRDGAPDPSFGINGRVAFRGGYNGKAIELPDGKILLCYYYSGFIGNALNYYYVVRLLANGQYDPSFGNNGTVQGRYSSEEYETDAAYSLAVKPNGKILVAGILNFYEKKSVFQLLPNGALDTSFGDKGYLVSTSPYETTAYDILALPSGKFVVAYDNAIIKYTAAGKIDTATGNHGVYTNVPAGRGKQLYLKGKHLYAACKGTVIYKFGMEGTLDSSFAASGVLQLDAAYNPFLSFDDKGFYIADASRFAVSRYTLSGKPDLSFGTLGTVSTTFSGYSSQKADAPVVPCNGEVIIVGRAIGSYVDIALAQFTNVAAPVASTDRMITTMTLPHTAISVWPNPVQNELHISNLPAGDVQVYLTDNSGRTVQAFSRVAGNLTIDLSKLSAGIYYVRFPGYGQPVKVVKE